MKKLAGFTAVAFIVVAGARWRPSPVSASMALSPAEKESLRDAPVAFDLGQGGQSSAGSNTAAAACPSKDFANNPLNMLSCLIARDPGARKDVGERLARFVKSHDAQGRWYLAYELRRINDPDDAMLPMIAAIAKAWPDKNKADPGRVAVLYFMIGADGELPAWAQDPLLAKTLRPGMKWTTRLQDALADKHWTDMKQISLRQTADATSAFLDDAAAQAKKILDDPRTPREVRPSVMLNDAKGAAEPAAAPAVSGDTPSAPQRRPLLRLQPSQTLHLDGANVPTPP